MNLHVFYTSLGKYPIFLEMDVMLMKAVYFKFTILRGVTFQFLRCKSFLFHLKRTTMLAYLKMAMIFLLENFIERSKMWWLTAIILPFKAEAGELPNSKSGWHRKGRSQIHLIIS